MRTKIAILAALLALFAPAAWGTQREVGSGQTYTTIQSCLNAAASGDICNVHAGTYSESPTFAVSTTLQVNGSGRAKPDAVVVNGTITNSGKNNSVVDGFEVTGYSVSLHGGIDFRQQNGGIIRNNYVHDGTGSGIYVRQSANTDIYSNRVVNTQGPCCISDGDGIISYSSTSTDNTWAHGVRIHDNEVSLSHQDGVIINGAYESIYHNFVHDNIYSNYASVHPDGIECNSSADGFTECPHTLIYGNTVKNQNQNIYIDGLGTAAADNDIWIFNNVVYNDPTSSTGVSMATGSSSAVILNVGTNGWILNNTIGGVIQYFNLCLGDCTGGGNTSWAFTNVTIKNNVFMNSSYIGMWTFPSTNVIAMDYDIWYNASTALVHWGSTNYNTLSAIQSGTGMEAHGQVGNPSINSAPADTLQSTSIARGNGQNLSTLAQGALLARDRNGTARPGGAWDVGALQFTAYNQYFLSYVFGSNSNDGRSEALPWKSHPYMQTGTGCAGAAPAYAHAAGDHFNFKQGDRWPNACLDIHINAGGAVGNPDTYTYDPGWGVTSSPGVVNRYGDPIGTWTLDAQGVAIAGSDGWNDYVYDNNQNDVTFYGTEFVGMWWNTASPGSFGNEEVFQMQTTTDLVLDHGYVHGWTHAGASTGGDTFTVMVGHDGSPFNAGSGVFNTVVDGSNSCGAGCADSGEVGFKASDCHGDTMTNLTNACLTNVNGTVHDNSIGPIVVSLSTANHQNCIENIDSVPAGQTGTQYVYNNVMYNCYEVGLLMGGLNGGGSEKLYVWNNVYYDTNQSPSRPIPFQFSEVNTGPVNEVHAWNNTIEVGSSNPCMRTLSQGGSQWTVLDLQNNFCVSNNGFLTNSAPGATQTINNNPTMTLAQASAAGLNSSETYAFQPLTQNCGGQPSCPVLAGVNLTSLATGGNSGLQQDTTYGGIRTTNTRPASGTWDAGAYIFTGGTGPSPSPPTNPFIIIITEAGRGQDPWASLWPLLFGFTE